MPLDGASQPMPFARGASREHAPAALGWTPRGRHGAAADVEPAVLTGGPVESPVLPLSICKVWQAEYPWDVRAEKIARALTRAGHRVSLLARNRTGLPEVEQRLEARVHRLAQWRWAPKWLDAAATLPAFFNPRWLQHIARVARDTRADVILCRDLPLAIPSILVAKRLNISVVLDMAENYPAMLESRRLTGRSRPWDSIVRNPGLARLIEEWALPRVDGALVVVEEARARLLSMAVPPQGIALVSNTPPLSRLESRPATQLGSDVLRAVYLGRVEAQRGIGTLLEAAALLRAEAFPLALTIYGDGVDLPCFQQRAKALALEPPTVVFRGQVPNAVALAELADAHIGIVPHWKDECWDTTVPNKLFDYMAAGLAVVTSDAVPAKRIVEACGCGVVYQNRDAADLARALRQLRDATVRCVAANRGRVAIRTTYHWERDVDRLLALLATVVARRR
jgi:glycosyltransferase involved in cell wall biosynthesis